ncbi:MAG: T9SS type A sorting domain-containing protein, partial [Saprospiraceae bacterium]|nr:T9SS type A sorting domain-containing protein [Saprospiraceae bacterium]
FRILYIMRSFYLVFLCVCLANSLPSQTFYASPDPLLVKEIQFDQANECIIHFDNPGGDSLLLHWRLVESNLPEEWDADLCDYGLCYIGIPSNGLMSTVYDTIQPYLKLIVQPGNVAGATWIWFRVYEEGNPDNFEDVFYSLHTPGTLSTNAQEISALSVYPNPTSDQLYLENRQAVSGISRIFNANGQLMWAGAIPANGLEQIGVGEWPAGLYFLQTGGQTKKILVQK